MSRNLVKLSLQVLFQFVARHQLNAGDISPLACDNYDLPEYNIEIMFSEHSLN